jgi:hypothetical protein
MKKSAHEKRKGAKVLHGNANKSLPPRLIFCAKTQNFKSVKMTINYGE